MKRSDIHSRSGGTIFLVLVTIFIVGGLGAIAFHTTANIRKFNQAQFDFTKLRLAAESALEIGFSAWLTAANNRFGPPVINDFPPELRNPDVPGTAAPLDPPSFSYANQTTARLQINPTDQYGSVILSPSTAAVGVPVRLEKYPGWSGFRHAYIVSVTMRSENMTGRTVDYAARRSADYVSVPLFQAMAFFEDNIELYKPATMIVDGLVHTNKDALVSYSDGNTLTFQGNLSYSAGYSTTEPPVGATAWSSGGSMNAPIYPSGEANQVHMVDRMEPLGTDPDSILNDTDSNPNNDSLHELIERPVDGKEDPPSIAGRRLFNKAGIVVTVNGGSKSVETKNGVTLTNEQITNIKNAISHETIYDKREGKYVDVSTMDISVVAPILESTTGFATNGILYFSDTGSTGENDPKAIRLKNGGILPSAGLTVVSDNGVYIQGDYNVGTLTPSNVPSNNNGNPNNVDSPVASGYDRPPSAVIGDAVMVLSNSWNDSNSEKSLSSRSASHTTVNTAILSGYIPSGWEGNGSTYGYSGGFNNFPRFLETWSNDSFTYFGSMIALFNSKTFIGEWDTGDIYRPPKRCWNYDIKFLTNPPPGSMDVVSKTRGPFLRVDGENQI